MKYTEKTKLFPNSARKIATTEEINILFTPNG